MPCYENESENLRNENRLLESMLCKTLKLLDVEQIKSIQPNTNPFYDKKYNDAYQWYLHHLHDDLIAAFHNNKDIESMQRYQKEIEKLGGKIVLDDKDFPDFPVLKY